MKPKLAALIAFLTLLAWPGFTAGTTNLVDIGGRKLQMAVRGTGSPTIIIEAGMGEPAIESGSWNKVVDELCKSNRVVLYNRAGLGQSDPAPKRPRTSVDVANDLHALLTQAALPGPYLLVGHSYGGLHLRMFASQFPDKVAGMVLVDTAHPDQDEQWLAALPASAPDEPESIREARKFLLGRKDPASNPEQIDPKASEAQVRAAHGLGAKPLVILSHSSKFRLDQRLPEDVSQKLENICQKLQADLKRISSNSTLRQSVSGGHYLQKEDPDLVIHGIRQALDAVNHRTK